MAKYLCEYTYDDGEYMQWDAEISLINSSDETVEAEIEGRGSIFDVVIGTYRNGRYICIPDLDVGCSLADLNDVYWNYNRVAQQVGITDAITIAYGLKELDQMIERKDDHRLIHMTMTL